MLFEITYYASDACGNSEYYLFGVCEFADIEAAEREFPRGVFCGWDVDELIISTPEEIKERLASAKQKGHIL